MLRLTCESQQEGEQEGTQRLPRVSSHGRRCPASPERAGSKCWMWLRALDEPLPVSDSLGWALQFLTTRPPQAWSSGLSHNERSGHRGPHPLPNPKPSGKSEVSCGRRVLSLAWALTVSRTHTGSTKEATPGTPFRARRRKKTTLHCTLSRWLGRD